MLVFLVPVVCGIAGGALTTFTCIKADAYLTRRKKLSKTKSKKKVVVKSSKPKIVVTRRAKLPLKEKSVSKGRTAIVPA